MKRFKHINANSIEEATSILRELDKKARVIAGGTDLIGEIKDDILSDSPEVIVNIKTIPGLEYIREEGGTLKLGVLTRLEDIARDKTIKKNYVLLANAARQTASPHIREMGTIGGNICQTNRCWYYWVPNNRFYCLRKGGKMCYAVTGDGRYHSIFGSTRVNGTPCAKGCPDNVNIPDYLSEIREGNMDKAAQLLMENNPLPAITGRVCPHFCESECNRGNFDEAVSIRCAERFMGDYILSNYSRMYKPPLSNNNKKIAVIGSGPSGLAAAYYLRQKGFDVTIFEKMEEAGGLLLYGIPPYRLPKDVVRNQVKALEAMGIKFKLNARVGQAKLKGFISVYDAVYIASGAWKERPSGIEGEQFMTSGAEFLRNSNLGTNELPGKNVAVIGGGNVAIDVARTLLRMGSEPVIIYRRGQSEMPALKDEVAKAQEEGIKMQFLTLPVKATKKGSKLALQSVKMKLGPPDESGRPRPAPVKGSEFVIEYDAVLTAIGEEADISILPEEFLNGQERLEINPSTHSLAENIFAGGDFVTGPATVAEAIAAGRKAASSINKFLGGRGEKKGPAEFNTLPDKFNSDYLKKTARAHAPELSIAERLKGLNLEEVGNLKLVEIEREANRCFNCGCVAVNPSDMAPALIVLGAKIVTSKRVLDADEFFAVGVDTSTVLDMDEIVTEIEVPTPGPRTRSIFAKFALRKSIDFPVVNCAAAIESEKGLVKSARICLNSVYNKPYRVFKVEEYITGKPITESNAEKAADKLLEDALPLVNNKYKIQITRTLVKRALLACKAGS